jgi:hypothetical protein
MIDMELHLLGVTAPLVILCYQHIDWHDALV